MQTKPKANSIITHERLEDGQIRFCVKGAGFVDFDLNKVSWANRDYAAVHGFIQRISDGAAISRNPENGQPATPAEKLAAIEAIVNHYHSGTDQWKMLATGTGGAGSLTLRAIARLKQVEYDVAEQYVSDYVSRELLTAKPRFTDQKGALAFLRQGKLIREAMAQIRQESAGPARIDADSAVDELGNE